MHGQLQQSTVLCCRCISREQFCFAGALFSLQQQTVLFCNSSVLQAHCFHFSNKQLCVAVALFSLQQQTVLFCRRIVFTSATKSYVLQSHCFHFSNKQFCFAGASLAACRGLTGSVRWLGVGPQQLDCQFRYAHLLQR